MGNEPYMYRLPNAYDYSIPLIMKSTSPFVYTTPVESTPFSFCRMHPSSRRCRRSRIYLYCRPIPLGIQRTRSVYIMQRIAVPSLLHIIRTSCNRAGPVVRTGTCLYNIRPSDLNIELHTHCMSVSLYNHRI